VDRDIARHVSWSRKHIERRNLVRATFFIALHVYADRRCGSAYVQGTIVCVMRQMKITITVPGVIAEMSFNRDTDAPVRDEE